MKRTRFPDTALKPLNERQKIFVKEYIIDFNASRACVAAGYAKSSSYTLPYDLLKRDYIRKAIRSEIDKRLERIQISQDRVVYELARIAFSDMRNFAQWGPFGVTLKNSKTLTDKDAACIAEISESDTSAVRFKLYDKLKALELLGRHLGMFNDKLELSGQVKQVDEHKYHVIQELISDPNVANRVIANFRSRTGSSTSAT